MANKFRYIPGKVPSDPNQLPKVVRDEFLKLKGIIEVIVQALPLDERNAAPDKYYDGMMVRADGTNWNPGSGQGVYCYYNSTWNYLG